MSTNDGRPRPNLGFVCLLTVPLAAGAIHFIDFNVGQFRSSGWLWILYLFAALFLIQAECSLNPAHRNHFPLGKWIGWVSFLWLSLIWCDGIGQRNVQDAMQISMPLAIAVMASMYARSSSQIPLLMKAAAVGLTILLLRVAMIRLGLISDDELMGSRVFSITAVFFGAIGVAWASKEPWAGYPMWLGCLMVTAGTGSRTATAVVLCLPIINPLNRSWMMRVGFVAAASIVGLGIFYTPEFQERFFHNGSGTLTDVLQGNFLSFGRFESWPAIFDEALRRPLRGAGVGEVVEFVPTVWLDMDKPHNEYLRIFFETGLIGSVLFWAALFLQYRAAVHLCRTTTGWLRVGFAASAIGLASFAILALTDNVLIYSLYFNNLIFGMLGLCYGVEARERAPDQVDPPSDARLPRSKSAHHASIGSVSI